MIYNIYNKEVVNEKKCTLTLIVLLYSCLLNRKDIFAKKNKTANTVS